MEMRVGRRKSLLQCQKGILLCNTSLQEMFAYLQEKYSSDMFEIQYILIRRLNQDILENFFSYIQSMGSGYDHLIPVELKLIDRFLKKERIARKFTTSYTPQNGVAERKNCTLIEMTRCMLTQSKLPTPFWTEAVATANFIRNRCITRTLQDKTPYELWYGKRPNVKHMRIFGGIAYMLDKTSDKGKLEARGIRCIFLGYDESSRSY